MIVVVDVPLIYYVLCDDCVRTCIPYPFWIGTLCLKGSGNKKLSLFDVFFDAADRFEMENIPR